YSGTNADGGSSNIMELNNLGDVILNGILQVDGTGDSYFAGNLSIGKTTAAAEALDVSGNGLFDGFIAEPAFTSGWQGTNFKIWESGNAEFQDVKIRGGLQVWELIINQLRYQDGGFILGHGGGKISSVASGTAGSEQIYIEDPSGNNYVPFTAGSIVLVQVVDLDDTNVVKKIVREVSAIQSDNRIDLTTTTGWGTADDTGSLEKDDVIVAIGHTSDNTLDSMLYMSAVDSNSPFLRIMDGVNSYSEWNLGSQTALKLQIGNLEGTYGYSDGTEVYGLAAGEPSGDYFTIDPTNGIRFVDGANSQVGAYFSSGEFLMKDSGGTTRFAFHAANNTAQIAGWDFDGGKLYNGTAIQLDANNKRLSIDSDATVVGDLTGISGTSGYGVYSNNAFMYGRFSVLGENNNEYAGIASDTSGSINTNILIWAGDSYANRSDAEFKVYDSGRIISQWGGDTYFEVNPVTGVGFLGGATFTNYELYTKNYSTSGGLYINWSADLKMEMFDDSGEQKISFNFINDNFLQELRDSTTDPNTGDDLLSGEISLVNYDYITGNVTATTRTGNTGDEVTFYFEAGDETGWTTLDSYTRTNQLAVQLDFSYSGLSGYTKFRTRIVEEQGDWYISDYEAKQYVSNFAITKKGVGFLATNVYMFNQITNPTSVEVAQMESSKLYLDDESNSNFYYVKVRK
ncbi:hypothetical protein KGY79_13515, partial [Candidatus Bipolaricaulota bacterium]|nr:hypothetical protein [Candidatus Bipolaricaulota bacterium]